MALFSFQELAIAFWPLYIIAHSSQRDFLWMEGYVGL
jgi:hypothetical protein